MHGAVFDASAATDARRLGERVLFVKGAREYQDRRGPLGHGAVNIPLCKAHHGAAVDDLGGGLGKAAAVFDKIAVGGADVHQYVFGRSHAVAVHCHNALDEGRAAIEGGCHGGTGLGVEDDASELDGKFACGQLFPCQCVNDLTLVALGIFGHHLGYLKGKTAFFDACAQYLNGILFVVLHRDGGSVKTQRVTKDLGAVNYLVGALQHQSVVGGDEGLALGAVDDELCCLANRSRELCVGGEGGAAHARYARGAYELHDLVGSSVGKGLGKRRDVGTDRVFAVVLDDHIANGHPLCVIDRIDGNDLARNAGVHGTSQTRRDSADHLSVCNRVSHLDQRLAVSADVLGEGNGHRGGGGHHFDGTRASVFVLLDVRTASKCKCQNSLPSFLK